MPSVRRILDANANRAREALRVMEEAARFLIADPGLTGDLKGLRHDLRPALAAFGPLEPHRDTPGDVGTACTTAAEGARSGPDEVARAAGKRLGEALRAIEEYGKTIDPAAAAAVESLRYRGYDLEARLLAALGARRPAGWRVCVLLTEALCARPWEEVARAVVAGGADAIQVREKTMEGGPLLGRTRGLIEIARPAGVAVIVNDRLDVALAAGADGVHLGTDDLPIAEARRQAGGDLVIGASTHDLDEARAAIEAGADACGVGAMFASSLKPDRTPSGPAYLAAFVERYPDVPHLAIGGVTAARVPELRSAGARGVAVSTAVCGAEDPEAETRAIVEAMAAATVPAG